MISGITISDTEVFVSSANSYYPYIYPDVNNPTTGTLRCNNGNIEVCTSQGAWTKINSPTYITLQPSARAAINWAIEKMNEEKQLKELAEKHPTVKHAMDQVNQAQEQLKVIATLCKE